MPQPWNNIIVVTQEELVPAFYANHHCLSVVAKRHEERGYGIKRVQSGGGANRKMLIDFDSLPRSIQDALGDPRKVNHILEKYYRTDTEAIEFYTTYKFADGSYLDDPNQEEYITNASMLKALKQLNTDRIYERTSKGGNCCGIMKILREDAQSFNKVLKSKWNVEHTLPESDRRFKDTFNKFNKEGFISLIDGRAKNQNAKKRTDKTETLLNNMFATQTHKPTYAEVASQYEAFISGKLEVFVNETGEVYNPADFKLIKDGAIKKFLSSWENEIGNEAKRSGNRQKLMGKFSPYHSRLQPKFSGSIVSVDDRQPPFEYDNGKRAWFYNAIDLASGAFICWVYGKTKEGIILEFYRQMVRNCYEWGVNLPAEIECESSLNSQYADTFLKEGNFAEHVRIEPNNARGKRIEAYYRALRYQLEKKHPGWLARPFALSESNQIGGEKVPFIPYDQIIHQGLKDIETWNNMPHNIEKSKSRWEYWLEHQNPDIKPTNYRRILPHLGYKTQTSCHAGIIKLQGNEYLLGDNGAIYTGEKLIQLMKNVEGQNINIYWLDANDGSIIKALVYIGDQYQCEAISKPVAARAKIEQTADDAEKSTLMSKYKATIDGYMRTRKNKLEKLTIIDNREITVNKKFSIFGTNEKVIEECLEHEVEMLPEIPEEDYLTPVETSFKTTLKERF